MIDIILNGACGRMGSEVSHIASSMSDINIAARVDTFSEDENIIKNIDDCNVEADIIVDFSNHLATKKLLEFAVRNSLPVIIATTGHTDEEKEFIYRAGKQIPVFYSANMSLGVAVLCDLAVKAAVLMPDADIEITETHHNRKADAPSGTALMIANALKKVRKNAILKLGRNGYGKREKNEIGINAVRRGNIVGIHEINISTDNQTLTLKHEAHSRALFAEGAISAARFMLGKQPGLYDMNSIVKEGIEK